MYSMSRDGGDIYGYRNGTSIASNTLSLPLTNTTGSLTSSNSSGYGCIINSMLFWSNITMSSAQMSDFYNAYKNTAGEGLPLANVGSTYQYWDSQAEAYLHAVGIANTYTVIEYYQAEAIREFIVTGKAQGWFSKIKRLWLPIWGHDLPNKIDLITGTSIGGFTDVTVTERNYVYGNGSTSFFDSGTTPD
jgi:hypothetical protein